MSKMRAKGDGRPGLGWSARGGAMAAAMLVAGVGASAWGNVTLSATSALGPEVTLNVGDVLSVDVMLTGPVGVRHNSAIFWVLLTEPGLELLSYAWNTPYQTGGFFENSTPGHGVLPLVVDANTFVRRDAPSLVDVEFSNVVDPASGVSTAGVGRLLTLQIRVPATFTEQKTVFLFAIPDTLALGFDPVPTATGTGLTLHIVPTPGALACMAAGVWVAGVGRRRRR